MLGRYTLPLCLLLPSAAGLPARADETASPGAELRLNQLQLLGSHNSYKQAIDPPLLQLLAAFSREAEQLDYAHPPLSDQLKLGLRGLELDLYHDPRGGRFANPLGLEVVRGLGREPAPYDAHAMLRPGFKVMHVADIDFRSHQPTLAGTLAELKAWSRANAGHLPVVVTMNLKSERAPVPGGVSPLPFDAAALDALDAALRAGLGGDRLLTPDAVRGDSDTLRGAVLTRGWPTLSAARGRFLFAIDEGGQTRRDYLRGHPSLRGRVMFTTPQPNADDAAVLILNDPLRQGPRIARLVQQGFLVRTRADAGGVEARAGDTRRLRAAVASGAHVISTDYYQPDPRMDSGYHADLGGGRTWRPNPLTGPPTNPLPGPTRNAPGAHSSAPADPTETPQP